MPKQSFFDRLYADEAEVGGHVVFIDVQPYRENYPGLCGAECGVSYFNEASRNFDSFMLIYRIGYYGQN